ncbi:MAG TPA: phosphodiester glycosidase family protein [Rhodanobacteraceae bacterium]
MRRSLVHRLALGVAFAAFRPGAAESVESKVVHADEADYRVVAIDLRQDVLELYWRDAQGTPYRSIDVLKRDGESEGRMLLFATNAGMYDRQFRPLGLTIAGGKILRPLNPARGSGSGNFGLQPNGIFYVDAQDHADVVPSATWTAQAIDARVATQSGPMLVIDGEVNPAFVESSDSRKWRSGVCAQVPDRVVFAVSRTPVTFHAFARLFRDNLGCREALYLDGTLSQIYTSTDGYDGAPDMMVKPYAGMLAVFAGRPASE